VEISGKARITQGFLSELESGRKRLTYRVAQKLAPTLGTTADRLVLGEQLATLNRAARKGDVDFQSLLTEAEKLTRILPSGKMGDAILDALVGVVRERSRARNSRSTTLDLAAEMVLSGAKAPR
jgi:transcriptional regulator with XRE-family HTH domain